MNEPTPMDTRTDRQARQLQQGFRALVRRFSLAERSDMSCCGMTVAQAATLQALADGALRLGELSKRLGITASTLTRNVARLEERGFVGRIGDPDDGRAQTGRPDRLRASSRPRGRAPGDRVRPIGPRVPAARLGNLDPRWIQPTVVGGPPGDRKLLPGSLRPPHDRNA